MIFDFFKNKTGSATPDAKELRHRLLHFIKNQLQKSEGGEGVQIHSIHLYVTPPDQEKHLYEAALYAAEEGRFKKEQLEKIADDYGLALPQGWTFTISFEGNLPEHAAKAPDLPAAISFHSGKKQEPSTRTQAVIKILQGSAEHDVYTIGAGKEIINIGREKAVQTSAGFNRINSIAFTGTEGSNQYISRQHAHIAWDGAKECFLLFADEGGVPPRNKVKIKTTSGEVIKLQSTQIGHVLQEGDQIMLGESALLQFSFQIHRS